MSQYQTGTVDTTQNSAGPIHNRIIGSADVDWSFIVSPGSARYDFSLVGSSQIYQIATVTAPASSASGKWEITVTTVITETPDALAVYTIQKDFLTVVIGGTTYYLAQFNPGDVQTAQILARNNTVLVAILTAIAAVASVGGGTVTPAIVSHTKVVAGGDIGVDRIQMPFSAPLAALPTVVFTPFVKKATANDTNIFVVSVDTITVNGYYVNLNAPAIAGQIITGAYLPSV